MVVGSGLGGRTRASDCGGEALWFVRRGGEGIKWIGHVGLPDHQQQIDACGVSVWGVRGKSFAIDAAVCFASLNSLLSEAPTGTGTCNHSHRVSIDAEDGCNRRKEQTTASACRQSRLLIWRVKHCLPSPDREKHGRSGF